MFRTSFAVLAMAGSLLAASFDCAKAKTKTEKRICKDPVLSALDDSLNRAYVRYQSALLWNDSLIKAQGAWCRKVRDTCTSKSSLESALRSRISEFGSSFREYAELGGTEEIFLWRWGRNTDGTPMPVLLEIPGTEVGSANAAIEERCRKQEHDPERECQPTEVIPTVTLNARGIFSLKLEFAPDGDCGGYARPLMPWTEYLSYDLRGGSLLVENLFGNWEKDKRKIIERFVRDDSGGYTEDVCQIVESIMEGCCLESTPLFTGEGLTIQTHFPSAIWACSGSYTVPYGELRPFAAPGSALTRFK